ncbi:hypothetical protein ADL01_29580 [Streptomyces sp. NRRL WC-3618]|nr:hypothetical protein ADL01_29580 [Streptomyces sp. NRRL WC-3618]
MVVLGIARLLAIVGERGQPHGVSMGLRRAAASGIARFTETRSPATTAWWVARRIRRGGPLYDAYGALVVECAARHGRPQGSDAVTAGASEPARWTVGRGHR